MPTKCRVKKRYLPKMKSHLVLLQACRKHGKQHFKTRLSKSITTTFGISRFSFRIKNATPIRRRRTRARETRKRVARTATNEDVKIETIISIAEDEANEEVAVQEDADIHPIVAATEEATEVAIVAVLITTETTTTTATTPIATAAAATATAAVTVKQTTVGTTSEDCVVGITMAAEVAAAEPAILTMEEANKVNITTSRTTTTPMQEPKANHFTSNNPLEQVAVGRYDHRGTTFSHLSIATTRRQEQAADGISQ